MEINIKVNVNIANKNIGIKCEADNNLTVGDFIRVVDSLRNEHINVLQAYMVVNPDADVEKVTIKMLQD